MSPYILVGQAFEPVGRLESLPHSRISVREALAYE